MAEAYSTSHTPRRNGHGPASVPPIDPLDYPFKAANHGSPNPETRIRGSTRVTLSLP